jgi:prepilin-type N-terminal cleavage/methylation domain-containing protein
MLKKNKKMKTLGTINRHGSVKPTAESLESLTPRILEPRSKGFTLIEIIVVIIILSIVSAITIKFLVDSMRIYTMTVNQKTLFDEGKFALERMCRDIRDAQSISIPNTGTSGTSITFVRAHTTVYDSALDAITFSVPATTLIKSKTPAYPGSATPALAEHVAVTGFTVRRGQSTTSDLNEITLTLNLSLTSGENVTLQTRVYPRNLSKDTGVPPTYTNFYNNWREVNSP